MKSFALIADFDVRKGIERWENEGGRTPRSMLDAKTSTHDNGWLSTTQDQSDLPKPAADGEKTRTTH